MSIAGNLIWMSGRALAPAPLDLVQRFVNTAELLENREDLDSSEALGRWLTAEEFSECGAPSEAEFSRALRVREGIRSVLRVHSGGCPDPDASELLNRAVDRAGLRPQFTADSRIGVSVAGGGVDGVLGRLLAIAVIANTDGSWSRLKACSNPDCGWAFYDRSRNRAGRWCEMNTCGARHKMRNFRATHRPPDALSSK